MRGEMCHWQSRQNLTIFHLCNLAWLVPYTVPVKGIAALHACNARVLHAHYTQCPRSCHAVSTHHTRKYTKMRVITRVQFHAVRIDIACKITRSRSIGAH